MTPMDIVPLKKNNLFLLYIGKLPMPIVIGARP